MAKKAPLTTYDTVLMVYVTCLIGLMIQILLCQRNSLMALRSLGSSLLKEELVDIFNVSCALLSAFVELWRLPAPLLGQRQDS